MAKHSGNTRTKKQARRISAKARQDAFSKLSEAEQTEQKVENRRLYEATRTNRV